VTIVAASGAETTESETEPTESAKRAGPMARLLMLPIRAYRLISVHLPPRCRYHPSCSAYALEAVRRHGVRRGGRLALGRVCRCHPWGGHGCDPVPPPLVLT